MRGGFRGASLPPAFKQTISPPGPSPDLNLTSGGTFARALEASYYTQAPTDGSSAFLAWATSGTRRAAEQRGDGNGVGLLMEKATTNEALRNQDAGNAAWSTTGSVTVTSGQPSPDGGGADRIQASANAALYQTFAASAVQYVVSAWVRSPSGTNSGQLVFARTLASSGGVATAFSQDTTYARREGTFLGTATNYVIDQNESRDCSAIGGDTATAHDAIFSLAQLEASYYPTSAIRTVGSNVTRPKDTLSYASGSYPAGLITTGLKIVFAPDASSAEIVASGETWRIIENGSTGEGIYLTVAKGEVLVFYQLNGAGEGYPITFSRGQALTLVLRPSGNAEVSGATTGNTIAIPGGGGGGTLTAGQTLYIGGDNAGANNCTGRFLDARGYGLVPCIQIAT